MFDLYLDRNKKDIPINATLNALKIFIKHNKNNTIQEYGKIIKKNKIAILWGLKSKFKNRENLEVWSTFEILADQPEECLGAYIISMTSNNKFEIKIRLD